MKKQKINILAASMLTLGLAACGGGDEPTAVTTGGGGGGGTTYSISGTVSGLTVEGLTLTLGGSETLTIAADATALSFTTKFADAAPYQVSGATQPVGVFCSIENASGTIAAANIENVAVSCAAGYSVSGTIEGLNGETATLSLNGSEELITTSGVENFTFLTGFLTDSTYAVTVTTSPDTYSCTVEQGEGTVATEDITNVLVKCLPPTAWNMIDFSGLSVTKPRPIVEWGFKVIDRFTGEGVNDLTLADFQVLQDNEELSPRESFLELDKLTANDNFTFSTVFMLDISASLTNQDIDDMKEAVKNIIRDPETGDSLIDANQTVAIYTFDEDVYLVASATNNIDSLISKIDTISTGKSSTNLFGAIEQGANTWTDVFSIEQVRTGAMIVVTDGRDTSKITPIEDAIDAVGKKSVFAIFVGDATQSTTAVTDLQDIVGAKRVYTPTDFTAFSGILAEAKAEADKVDDGLYILYYATPSRAGTVEVTVKALDNTTCDVAVADEVILSTLVDGCSDYFTLTFNADDLESIDPEFKLSGPLYVSSGNLTVTAETFWTNNADDYTWTITSLDDSLTWTTNTENTVSTLSLAAGKTGGSAVVTVRDNNLSQSLSKTYTIGTGVSATSNTNNFEMSVDTPSITITASSFGENTPNYSWSIDDATVATLSNSSGTSITLTRVTGNSTNSTATLTLTDTTNNYTRDYTITNLSTVQGITKVQTSWDRTCGLKTNDILCWQSGGSLITDNTKPTLSNPSVMTVGYRHNCAIDDNGLHCWGQSAGHGNTTLPSTLTNVTAVSARYQHSCAIGDNGVECWGNNSSTETNVPNTLANPSKVFTGRFNSCALDDNGVTCWGSPSQNLNIAPALTNPTTLSIGLYLNACAIDDNGISCWGYTGYNITSTIPVMEDPIEVSVGSQHACAIDNKSTGKEVVCWGQNGQGQTTVPSGVDALVNPTSVTAGQYSTCAVGNNGTQCWGNSSYAAMPQ
jgi:uncharacterized protein YegL